MGDEQRYLTELGQAVGRCAERVQNVVGSELESDEQVATILQEAIDHEKKLRDECDIGVRFNIIRSQLQGLHQRVENSIHEGEAPVEKPKSASPELADDETLVYVYLFNAQGDTFATWKKFLTPRVLIEHSVNRPIYQELDQVEAVLRSRSMPARNAYIAVSVKKADILQSRQGSTFKDQFGFPLLRLRQGSLEVGNIKAFVHQGKSYQLTADEQLIPQ